MRDMTLNERYSDIAKRCGMSENVVRSVLHAQAESICDSVKKGSNVTLPGICTITPEIRKSITAGNNGIIEVGKIKLKIKPVTSLMDKLKGIEKFDVTTEESEEEDLHGVRLKQITALL